MKLYDFMSDLNYEGLHVFTDSDSGLRAAVAIHDTRLGPALGGTRCVTYVDDAAALTDALRLARGMTYKAALAGIPHGGGKGVIIRPKGEFDRSTLFRAYGRAVERLGGIYITTEDSGTSPNDMRYIREETAHVVGIPPEDGGTGDPSPSTARGVFRGIEAAVAATLDGRSLEGIRVAIQGVGHVGHHLASELHAAGARLWVADVNETSLARCVAEFGAEVAAPGDIHKVVCDVFAPCALGGVINDQTLPELNCRIVAGASNNQLLDEARHGAMLREREIRYCPDYAINAGGLIHVAAEHAGHTVESVQSQIEGVGDTIRLILERAALEGVSEREVADRIVEERLEAAGNRA
jgi:leucine dehydrogenase